MPEAVQIEWWDRPTTHHTEITLWNHWLVCEFYYEFKDSAAPHVAEAYLAQRLNLSSQEYQA